LDEQINEVDMNKFQTILKIIMNAMMTLYSTIWTDTDWDNFTQKGLKMTYRSAYYGDD